MSVISVRTDPETDAALAELGAAANGASVTTIVRKALIDQARLARRERLREQSRAVAEDPDDRAEAQQVLRELESLRAW